MTMGSSDTATTIIMTAMTGIAIATEIDAALGRARAARPAPEPRLSRLAKAYQVLPETAKIQSRLLKDLGA